MLNVSKIFGRIEYCNWCLENWCYGMFVDLGVLSQIVLKHIALGRGYTILGLGYLSLGPSDLSLGLGDLSLGLGDLVWDSVI